MSGFTYHIPSSEKGKKVVLARVPYGRRDGNIFILEEGKVDQRDLKLLKDRGHKITEKLTKPVTKKKDSEKEGE